MSRDHYNLPYALLGGEYAEMHRYALKTVYCGAFVVLLF